MNLRLIFLVLFFGLITACKKYPDGNTFGNKKARIAKSWTLVNFAVNEKDVTGGVNFFFLDLEKNGDYRYGMDGLGFTSYSEEGKWTFLDKKMNLSLYHHAAPPASYGNMGGSTQPSTAGEEIWEIRRLNTKELWLRQQQVNGDVWEVHCKPYSCCR